MENAGKAAGLGYVLRLAGKSRILLLLSAIFSIISGLCTFIPYYIVYQVMVRLFRGSIILSEIRFSIMAYMRQSQLP